MAKEPCKSTVPLLLKIVHYGKKAYLDYRGTLARITRLDVEPVRVISCGNWAFEIDKESLDVTTPAGVDFSTSARGLRPRMGNEHQGRVHAK